MVQATHASFASSPVVGAEQTGSDPRGTSKYPDTFAATLADPMRCPLPVLLLFHQLPWRYTLPDGKVLAQHLYDTIFAGAAAAGNAVDAWESTRDIVDEPRYTAVHAFLQRAAMHTEIVRDATTEWVQNTSGVRDALGFVGSHTGRTAATDLQRSGFAAPRESEAAQTGGATGSTPVPCPKDCTATLRFEREANVYRVTVAYRHSGGGSTFRLQVNGDTKSTWNVSDAADSAQASGQTAVMERFTVNGVRLQPGDAVAVCISVDTGAAASLDFLEVTRDPRWN